MPSGDPEPSPQDRAATLRLVEAAEVLNIAVLDHLVITRSGFRSALESRRRPTASRR